jgi:hypothetical protein
MDAFPDLTVILDDRLPVSIPSWVCEPNSVLGRRVRFTNPPVVAAHFSHEHACPIRPRRIPFNDLPRAWSYLARARPRQQR